MRNLVTTYAPHQPDFCSSQAHECDAKDMKELMMAQQTGTPFPLTVW